jgi:hypothetical protein
VPGEKDLRALLGGLRPELDPVEYGFASLPPAVRPPDGLDAVCLFREEEGLTVIAPAAALAEAGLEFLPGWARITLRVHSSLEAVGMTAAFARALGDAGISANVVAAYHHDHVFLPWARRHDAMRVLSALANANAG